MLYSGLSNNSALISVIIPAYNVAPYIHRAIESSLRQTHANIEVLVIDDGSTDDTLKVAQSYAERNSRVRLHHQENRGVSAARNYGIREANGEYLVFLDADDWFEDYAIEVMLNAQMKYPDKTICSNFYIVRIDGTTLRRMEASTIIQSTPIDIKYIAESYCRFTDHISVFHHLHAKLFRASLAGTFPEGVRLSEDAIFFIEYVQKTSGVHYLSNPTENVLERPGSVTRSSYKLDDADSQEKAYKIIIDLVKDNEEIIKLMLMSRNLHIWWALNRAINANASHTEISRVSRIIKPTALYTLKCKRCPLQIKVRFFIDVYFPVLFAKAMRTLYKVLKAVRDMLRNKRVEVIENWQDFPSQHENR